MAGMFYSLQEVAAKLNIKEEEVKEIIKQGRLREFRDGSNLLFKVDEVEALMSDTSIAAMRKTSSKTKPAAEDEEISLAPEPSEEPVESGADTTATPGKGVDVLGEADSDYKLADDTLGETKVIPDKGALGEDTLSEAKAASGEASLEEIEGDVNLDTFGSGSGLLDLSLQADDTSLGGILDEIYTPEGEEGVKEKEKGAEASAAEVAAEAEQLIPAEGLTEPEPGPEAAVIVQAYAEPAPDVVSNAFGIILFVPLLAIIYTAIVAVAGFNNMMPAILTPIQRLIWYIVIGAVLAAGLIIGVAFILSNKGKGGKTTVKKKKAKKTKEAPPAEAEPESKSA
jgi:excisionase family DNA binding protein